MKKEPTIKNVLYELEHLYVRINNLSSSVKEKGVFVDGEILWPNRTPFLDSAQENILSAMNQVRQTVKAKMLK
jgi:hypothetical protein